MPANTDPAAVADLIRTRIEASGLTPQAFVAEIGPSAYIFYDRATGIRYPLTQLEPTAGKHDEVLPDCSFFCAMAEEEIDTPSASGAEPPMQTRPAIDCSKNEEERGRASEKTQQQDHIRTIDSGDSDAEICRRNGWAAGTRLSGVELGRREYIRITAVGMNDILAYWERDEEEHLTSLTCRNWRAEGTRP